MSRPLLSKKRISSDWGSRIEPERWTPPTQRVFCVVNRVTAGDATRRSRTSMPAAFSPAIIARLSMRAGRVVSRLITT